MNWAQAAEKSHRRKKIKFTKSQYLVFTCEFACEKKLPRFKDFSAYDFTFEIIEVKSILIPTCAA